MDQSAMKDEADIVIVYDGDCPFCSAYVAMTRLRAAAGRVELVDARDADHPVVREAKAAGLDLDEGMAMKMDGALYHGDAVMNRLALMTSPVGPFNALMRVVFRHPRLSRALYPSLRAGRNLALRLLGRKKIADAEPAAGEV